MSNESQPSQRNWKIYLLILLVMAIMGIIFLFAPLLPAIMIVLQNMGRSDCQWSASATTWIDVNRNGQYENDETPLANVQFFVDDVTAGSTHMSAGISNTDGKASLSIFIDGCAEDEMRLYPEIPADYCLTTPENGTSDAEQPYQFGFATCTGN